MMSFALALTISLITGVQSASQGDGAVASQLVRDACVGTGMRREALEQLARTRNWRELRTTSSSGISPVWQINYRTGNATVMMSAIPHLPSEPAVDGTACTVVVGHTGGDWHAEVAAVASEIGLSGPSDISIPGAQEVRVWSDDGPRTLTAAYVRDMQTLSITYVQRPELNRTLAPPPAGIR